MANAVERGQDYIERRVFPVYWAQRRGLGTEMAVQWFADVEMLAGPNAALPEMSWLARRRALRLSRNIHVTLGPLFPGQLSDLIVGRGRYQITLAPEALWAAGFRDSFELDDAVLRVLLARYGQILLVMARYPVPHGVPWSELVAPAKARDEKSIRDWRVKWGGWALVAVAIGAMMYAGANGL